MREFFCSNGKIYGLPDKCCAFCANCTDIYYDYTNGPYWFLCKGNHQKEPLQLTVNCRFFINEDGDTNNAAQPR